MDRPLIQLDAIRTIAVLGAGTMGHGIAQIAAQAGYQVRLRDMTRELVDVGVERIRANLDKGVSLGKVEPAARDAAVERLYTTTEVSDAVEPADVVIEAVPEVMDLKKEIFSEVAAKAPRHALLCTNTSSLSIGAIAEAGDPERLVGMHFFNPVHLMKLIEVVSHDQVAPESVTLARGLAEAFGKTPITVRDVPGFASSRLGLAIGLEAMRMVEQEVASAADIDTAMKLGYGHPMGPLELTDLVGLDVRLSIADYLREVLGDRFAPPQVLRTKVAEGKLGKKSGEGFYRWQGGKKL